MTIDPVVSVSITPGRVLNAIRVEHCNERLYDIYYVRFRKRTRMLARMRIKV